MGVTPKGKRKEEIGIGSTETDYATALEMVNVEDVLVNATILASESSTVATSTETGAKGEVKWDATHIFFCIDTDTWIRVALTAW